MTTTNSSLKDKLKHYAPHLVAGASIVALGVVLYKHRGRNLSVTDEDLVRLKDGAAAIYTLKDGTTLGLAVVDLLKK